MAKKNHSVLEGKIVYQPHEIGVFYDIAVNEDYQEMRLEDLAERYQEMAEEVSRLAAKIQQDWDNRFDHGARTAADMEGKKILDMLKKGELVIYAYGQSTVESIIRCKVDQEAADCYEWLRQSETEAKKQKAKPKKK